jgi:glycosyltransferase involved in cell wall biosynthesis
MNPHAEIESLAAAPAASASDSGEWPRIALVTAVRNGAKYLEDTIRSIVNQGYPNLEYIIVDGVSTDGTIEIIRKYESRLAWWVSRPDKGVYDALNTGFARSTGEIMGWLNASDQLHIKSLFVVGSLFRELSQVEWITGRPTAFDSTGMTIFVDDLRRWSRFRFLAGANRHIQQESTFWRRSLWNSAGGSLDSGYRDAGDCELWVRFFRHAKLYSVDALIGGYRSHADAISAATRDEYHRHFEEIIEREVNSLTGASKVRLFRKVNEIVQHIPKVRVLWKKIAFKTLYRRPASDWPPVVEYWGDKWRFRSQ